MEVKAQIKLRFVTSAGMSVVAIRSFQLTQKKAKMEYKALDQVLRTTNQTTNQPEAITYRCADFDRIVPQLMGVSKAILESVIFVHQEDSNWPLSEPTVLKKRFDEIFSATKYTKAVEAFKKLKKERTQAGRELNLTLENLKTHKDSAMKLRTEITRGSAGQQSLQQQIQELEDQIQAHAEEMNTINEKLSKAQELGQRLADRRTRLNVAISRNQSKAVQLAAEIGEDELQATLEELLQWKEQLEEVLPDIERKMQANELAIQAGEGRMEGLRRQHGVDVQQEAQLQAEATAHKKNLGDRDQALRSAADEFKISGLPESGGLQRAAVDKFVADFQRRVKQEDARMTRLRGENQREDDDASRLVDQVTAQITDASQKAQIKQQSLRQNETRIRQYQAQVEGSQVTQRMADDAAASEEAAKGKLMAREQTLEQQKFREELAKNATCVSGIQTQINTLRQEREKLADAAEEGARLQVQRKERNQKEVQLTDLLTHRKPRLAELLGCSLDDLPAPEKLKTALNEVQTAQQKRLGQLNQQAHKAHTAANVSQGSLDSCQAQRDQQQQEADTLQDRINTALNEINSLDEVDTNSPLEPEVEKLAKTCSKALDRKLRVDSLTANVEAYRTYATEHNECQVCQRAFKGVERERFMNIQDETLAALPVQMEKAESKLKKAEARLKAIRALQPDWSRLHTLRNQVIPDTEARVTQLEAKAAQEAEAAGNLQNEKQTVQKRVEEIGKLMTEVVWPVDRLAKELAGVAKELTRLENQMRMTGSTRTVGDVDTDLDRMEGERGTQERRKDDILRRQTKLRDEISHLQRVWHSAREEAMTARNAAEKRANLETTMRELQAGQQQLQKDAEEAAKSVEPLKLKRNEHTREREQKRATAREREAEVEGRMRQLHNMFSKIQDRCATVNAYEAAGKRESLEEVREKLGKTEGLLKEQRKKNKELDATRTSLAQQVNEEKQSKRTIDALIDHQRSLEEEHELKAEIEAAEVEEGIREDVGALAGRFTEVQAAISELKRKQNMAQGRLDSVVEVVSKAKREVGEVAYRNIDQRYCERLVQVKATEMVVQDLDKYSKALEKALLSFHTNKMAEINKVIKELWQKTYRNQDIDCIQIKADADGSKSYAYRVVMQTGGAELEMRGRCSAGQKVLACLIIRLALAETFCLRCGMLALDEPTTNLDEANSLSLAEALRNIMETRRGQANFQLIVITHDERFARMIGTKEHAEYMWRITKDENQHTHVAREEMSTE